MPCWTSSDQYERVRAITPTWTHLLPIHTWDLVTLMSHMTPGRGTNLGPIWTFSLRAVLTFVASCLDINGCVLSYFEGTANVNCYTSCTLTTLHCSKVSFLQCSHMKRYNKIFTKMWGVHSLLWDAVYIYTYINVSLKAVFVGLIKCIILIFSICLSFSNTSATVISATNYTLREYQLLVNMSSATIFGCDPVLLAWAF